MLKFEMQVARNLDPDGPSALWTRHRPWTASSSWPASLYPLATRSRSPPCAPFTGFWAPSAWPPWSSSSTPSPWPPTPALRSPRWPPSLPPLLPAVPGWPHARAPSDVSGHKSPSATVILPMRCPSTTRLDEIHPSIFMYMPVLLKWLVRSLLIPSPPVDPAAPSLGWIFPQGGILRSAAVFPR